MRMKINSLHSFRFGGGNLRWCGDRPPLLSHRLLPQFEPKQKGLDRLQECPLESPHVAVLLNRLKLVCWLGKEVDLQYLHLRKQTLEWP